MQRPTEQRRTSSRRPSLTSLAGLALALVIVASCSTSTPTKTSATTATPIPTSTTSTSPSTTSTTLALAIEGAEGSSGTTVANGGTVTGSASLSDEACRLVTAHDLTTAGITGTITGGTPMESGLQDDPSSSVCNFDLSDSTGGANLLITLSPKGGKSMFKTLKAFSTEMAHPITGLGDEAEFSSEKSDDGDNGASSLHLLVRKGDVVFLIQTPSAHFADETSLTALAKVIVPKLG